MISISAAMKFLALSTFMLAWQSVTALTFAKSPTASLVRYQESHTLGLIQQLVLKCEADPQNCKDITKESSNYSDSMQDKVIDEMNATEDELQNITFDMDSCRLDKQDGFQQDFTVKVNAHTACRQSQLLIVGSVTTTQQLVKVSRTSVDSVCENIILTRPVADLVDICKPSAQRPLGQWLQSMAQTFNQKSTEWEEQQRQCTEAEWAYENASARLNATQANLALQEQACEKELASLETTACSHTTSAVADCRSYNQCFENLKQEYQSKTSAVDGQIARWRETWIAAERLKCLHAAVGGSGAVDQNKIGQCQNASNFDASHIDITVPPMPNRQSCVAPDGYGGSAIFREMVYSSLPAGIQVRAPHLCLAWKGGCFARSSFPDSSVYLKQDGSTDYCGVADQGGVSCNLSKATAGKFVFKQPETSSCTGDATLYFRDGASERGCSFDPAGAMSLRCDGTVGPLTLMSNPLATGRSGEVSFKLEMPGGNTVDRYADTNYQEPGRSGDVFCGDPNNPIGFLTRIDTTWYPSKHDLSFRGTCAYPKSAFGAFSFARTFPPNQWTTQHGSVLLRCETGEVMSGISIAFWNRDQWGSRDSNDKQFKAYCAALPAGLTTQNNAEVTEWSRFPPNQGFVFRCPPNFALLDMHSAYTHANGGTRYYEFRCARVYQTEGVTVNVNVEYAIQNA